MQLPAYQKSAIMILVSYHHARSWWSNRIALCAPTQGAIFLFYFEYLSQREVVMVRPLDQTQEQHCER